MTDDEELASKLANQFQILGKELEGCTRNGVCKQMLKTNAQ